jgi:hypothetical protein
MTAKKSSIRTVVSGSDKGVWVRGFGRALAGEDVDNKDVAEDRRGSAGAESIDALGARGVGVGSGGGLGELL